MATDQALLERWAKEQDEQAFAELVGRHVGMVYGVARRMLGGPGREAEDVVQGVFWLLAQRAGRVKGEKLGGWLYRVAVYCCRNMRKEEGRRKKREREVGMARGEAGVDEETREGMLGVLDAGMMTLSERERRAVVARYLEGKTAAEAGAALGVSPGAAEKRAQRGVERLRRFFERRGVGVGAGAVVAVMWEEAAKGAPAEVVAGVAGASATGMALAKGAVMAMVWATVLRGAAGAAVVGTVVVGGLWAGSVMGARPAAVVAASQATSQAAGMADNPAYLAWVKHKLGTTAAWTQSGSGTRTGADGREIRSVQPASGFLVRLVEVTPEGAVVELTVRSRTTAAEEKSRVVIPAKAERGVPVMPLPSEGTPVAERWKEGEEEVVVDGKKIQTRTREATVASGSGTMVWKEWTAEGVPGALVKLETRIQHEGSMGGQTLELVEFHEAGEAAASAPAVPVASIGGVGRLDGKVVSVEGTTAVVERVGTRAVSTAVRLDDSVTYRVDGEGATAAAVKAGMTVSVAPAPPRSGKGMVVMAWSPGVRGKVVRVEGDKVVVSVRTGVVGEGEKEETIATDKETKVLIQAGGKPTREGKVEELAAGMSVLAIPPTGMARRIIAADIPSGPGGRDGGGAGVSRGMP
jgi:RNA polymerase sigma factor (sigma-70 family)